MSQRQLTKAQLTERFGETAKQIERYVHEGLPCTGTGAKRRFPWPEAARWRDDRLRRQEREATERKLKPPEAEDAKQAGRRRAVAEAKLVEIELAEKEGSVVSVANLEQVVGEMGDRLRAALINLPSTHGLELERLGLEAKDAERALEEIAQSLTRTLRGVADDLEAETEDDGA